METGEQIKIFRELIEKNYEPQLLETVRKGNNFLVLDFFELTKISPELAEELLENPEEILKAGELAIKEFDLPKKVERFYVRFNNLPESQKILINEIRSKHLNKFLWMEGVVRQKSDVRPHVVTAKFECPSCGNILTVFQSENTFREPSRCGCGRKGRFKELTKDLVDGQGLVLEEAPEDLEGGIQPKRMNVFLKNDLVSPITEKKTSPGNKVRTMGWVTEVPINLRSGGKSTKFDLMIEANYIEPVQEDFSLIAITDEEIKMIEELAKDPKIYQKLVNSIAPSIFGYEKIKEALILQLVGGMRKEREDGMITRGDMHVLLIGDPGSGKSQMLKRLTKVAPKGRYVSGKGVSGAGLTAAVVKDEFLGGWSLEAGALVLANKGFCLAGDTQILLADGKLKTIKQIVNSFQKGEEQKVFGLDIKTLKTKEYKIKGVSKRKPNKLFQLKFNTGDILKLTEEHPLPIWDNGIIWKKVDDVKENEHIISNLNFPSAKKTNYTQEFMEFLGLVTTDGHISKKKHVIRFYTKSKELEERFKQLAEKEFGKRCGEYLDKRSGVKQLFLCSKEICKKVTDTGIPKGKKNKLNFDKIINEPCDNIKAFLIGAINGDGSISNRKCGGCIDIICGSEETAEAYRKLFRRMGILSQTNTFVHQGGGVVKKGKYNLSKLTITGVTNIKKVYDERLESKKLNSLKQILMRKNTAIRIPKINKLFEVLRNKLKHGEKHILYKNSLRVSRLNNWSVSFDVFQNVVNKLENANPVKYTEEYKQFKKIKDNQIIFPKIIEKKEIELEEVYNIQTDSPKEPNFFANFLPVHNCMIDELDKMDKADRAAMHEALEGQTVSISKANIQATLRAETTVLAAANPKFGRFDPYRTVAEQIDLPPTLINRFDLIFPIKDLPDKQKDGKMADHILNLHQNPDEIKTEIETNLLKKYIAYARQRIEPVITNNALKEIKEYYIKMRNSGQAEEGGIKSIPITARQLEALIRLAEASAKSRLSNKVVKKDAQKAIELINYCLSQVAKDMETGIIDIDRISSGIPAKERSKISIVREIIDNLENEFGKVIPIENVVSKAEEKGLKVEDVEEIIEKLRRSGDLFEPRTNFIQKLG